jgi:hypothetical protein
MIAAASLLADSNWSMSFALMALILIAEVYSEVSRARNAASASSPACSLFSGSGFSSDRCSS